MTDSHALHPTGPPLWWEYVIAWGVENWGQVLLTLVGGSLCGLLGWWVWGER